MNVTEKGVIEESHSHLATALKQSLPSDDAIIMGHMRIAYDLLEALRRLPTGRSYSHGYNDPTDRRMQADEDAMTRDLARTEDGRPRW